MAVATLALFGVWLAMALLARMLMQKRRTGDAGFRGLRAGRPAHRWINGLLFVPIAAAVAAPIADLMGLRRIHGLDVPSLQGIGVAFAILGMIATSAAQLGMGDSWRVGVDESERTELVTTGAFRLVRNPIYAAAVTGIAGFAVMVPNVFSVVAVVSFVVAFELHVRLVEEPYLVRVHGAAYRRYAAAVGRFFPLVGRWAAPGD
jgi:protein-S-isoprenylcysteine O-methyltransferase Ste14